MAASHTRFDKLPKAPDAVWTCAEGRWILTTKDQDTAKMSPSSELKESDGFVGSIIRMRHSCVGQRWEKRAAFDLSWAQSQLTKVFSTPSTPLLLEVEEDAPFLAPLERTWSFLAGLDSKMAVSRRQAFS